ncbi:MAG TPA: MFS transporter [Thermoleophilaceae bacterium]|nr:MFS transporter [Thermoleophilaceae bacterium]
MTDRRNPPVEELYRRRWPIFVICNVGGFLAYLDATIVNVSVPELQRAFDADVVTVAWVVNAYNIAFAVPLVAMGRLADQFGRRRLMLIGLGFFGMGSLLCAIAPTIEVLIGARVLQGLGASILVPLTLATTIMVFPPEQRGKGVAIQAIIGNLGAVVGPVAGGLLLEYASWPWIFWINVPVCVIVFVLMRRLVPETYDPAASRRVDVTGMALLGGTVMALSLACVKGNDWEWGSPAIVGLLAAAVVLAALFVVSQRRAKYPTVPPAIARNTQFVAVGAAFVLFSLGMLGTFFLLIVGMVELWGYSELKAAMATLAIPAGAMLVAPATTRFSDRVAPRVLLVPSVLATAVGIWLLGSFPADADYLEILPSLLLIGIGAGATFPVGFAGGMGRLPGQEFGLGAGLLNVARAIGSALGVALIAAVFTGAVETRFDDARDEVRTYATANGYPATQAEAVAERLRFDDQRRLEPLPANATPLQQEGRRAGTEAAAESFGIAFKVAAGVVALALLLVSLMRSRVGATVPGPTPAPEQAAGPEPVMG